MNLIDRYGSYENAKNAFEVLKKAKDFYKADIVNHALKEYRRENNIFEAGDYFVNYADDAVYIALSIDQNNRMHGKSGDKNVWTYFGRFGLRHATDEEIEAGKRL